MMDNNEEKEQKLEEIRNRILKSQLAWMCGKVEDQLSEDQHFKLYDEWYSLKHQND